MGSEMCIRDRCWVCLVAYEINAESLRKQGRLAGLLFGRNFRDGAKAGARTLLKGAGGGVVGTVGGAGLSISLVKTEGYLRSINKQIGVLIRGLGANRRALVGGGGGRQLNIIPSGITYQKAYEQSLKDFYTLHPGAYGRPLKAHETRTINKLANELHQEQDPYSNKNIGNKLSAVRVEQAKGKTSAL